MRTSIIHILIIVILFIISSCNNDVELINDNNNDTLTVEDDIIKTKKYTQIIFPANNSIYSIGDSVTFQVEELDSESKIDSVAIFYGKEHIITLEKSPFKYTWKSNPERVGKSIFKTIVYTEDGNEDKNSVNINFKSDIAPKEYTVKIVKEYPHDVNAYTQGLIYENGFIYEGIGQLGESSIQKYRLKDHEIIQTYNNASNVFGEGIIITDNKLIQLTWQSGIGFIYDKETFKQIGKFNIQSEGWGLTSDGENLLMSDGSNMIHILETGVYTKIDDIEVYDNFGKVTRLNELEYINDQLYANLYRVDYDRIVIIDPKSGKITGVIHAENLRPAGVPRDMDHVLNGIAWNTNTNRLLLTGKDWPSIFEVELIGK